VPSDTPRSPVACVATLVWAGAPSALIVPQRSIAGIELNMTRPEVKDKKGEPDRIKHGTNDFGPYTQFIYRNDAGKLIASFQGNAGATGVWTNRKTQKTAEGVHVGSPESALHDAYPNLHCRTRPPTSGTAGRPLPCGPQGDGLPHRTFERERQEHHRRLRHRLIRLSPARASGGRAAARTRAR
jgi:hypothetical protein